MIIVVVINITRCVTHKKRICHPGFLGMVLVFLNQLASAGVFCRQTILVIKIISGVTTNRFLYPLAFRVVGVFSNNYVVFFYSDKRSSWLYVYSRTTPLCV